MRLRTVEESLKWYERAKKVIPGGAQTLSKQYGRMIRGVSSPTIMWGDGCYVYDYDYNRYIDWTASLGPVVLGYDYLCDYFSDAFRYGLSNVLLPMTNHLEVELAEKLIDIIPSAEMVRFFKSGSDATSAAIRLSRAISKKNRIICCGYHGWHDWYASTLPYVRSLGVVEDYNSESGPLTVKIDYGDLDQLEYTLSRYPACFILEPMNRQCPEKASKEYLQEVRKLCDKYGVILIFDEMIMGFRYAMAGGEEYFGVTPDLSCYGKAMANGFPLATLTGKRGLMEQIEHLQVSGTNFGELLSIKAALETIRIMEERNVIEHLWEIGTALSRGISKSIVVLRLEEIVNIKGWGPWSSLVWSDNHIQNYFLQEMAKEGILYNRDFFSTFSHTDEEVRKTLDVIFRIFVDIYYYPEKLKLEGEPINKDLFPV